MDLPTALHTAARAFCAERWSNWHREYVPLLESGQDRVGRGYSQAAYRIFPRYRLDEAIEQEVERTTGWQFSSLEEVRALLLDNSRSAFSTLLDEFQQEPEACAALTEEWKAFELYIDSVDPNQLTRVDPLPYRRVLAKSESEQLRQTLKSAWGANGYWFPLSKRDPKANVIAFHQELWEQRGGTRLLLESIQERGIERCLLLLEGPVDYEIAVSLVDPIYRGYESYITSDFRWLVYSSHESSIAVAGWLADSFRKQWPDWEAITYVGPFHTTDLRGNWGVLKK